MVGVVGCEQLDSTYRDYAYLLYYQELDEHIDTEAQVWSEGAVAVLYRLEETGHHLQNVTLGNHNFYFLHAVPT